MAKAPKLPPPRQRRRPTTAASNASGYHHRQSRKPPSNPTDIYENLPPPPTRRSRLTLSLGPDDLAFGAQQEEEEEEVGRARLIGEVVDGERVPSEEDEEVESDEAWEGSDEERFGGMGFASGKVCG
jgi:U3 small nucleolar RNA-associated protein 14